VGSLPQSHPFQGQKRCISSEVCFAVFNGNFDSLSPLHSIPQLHSQLGREEFEKRKCLHSYNKTLSKVSTGSEHNILSLVGQGQ
jgi:hypothetical protein